VWVSLWVSIPPNTTFSSAAAGIEDVILAMSALLVKKRTKGRLEAHRSGRTTQRRSMEAGFPKVTTLR
jgi:hypothetical protein